MGVATAVVAGSAVAGGVAGALNKSGGIAGASDFETKLGADDGFIQADFRSLRDLIAQGPNRGDVRAGIQAQRDFASTLRTAGQEGASLQDISRGRTFADQVFAPQEQALQRQFQEQGVQNDRLSARLGRPVNDPILRAKLAQNQSNQLSDLEARRGSFAAQQGQAQFQQRLGLLGQRANLLSGLGQQAITNRNALLGAGSNLLAQQQQFRLAVSDPKFAKKGGGIGGFFQGLAGGASAGLGVANAGQSLGAF